MYLAFRIQQPTTCQELTSARRTGSTSNSMTEYQSPKSNLIWLQKRLNRMMTKKNTNPTGRTCLMKQDHQTQHCSHSWRCFLNGVTKTKSSTVEALKTWRPRCNRSWRPLTQPFLQPLFFTRFYQRIQVHTVNQVCPSRISEIVRAQGENSVVQRKVRILTVQENPPNQMKFASTFSRNFSKTVIDSKSWTTCCTDSFFVNVGNLAYRQIVVPPETTEAIIRTMHGDPMRGHPGASKMLGELKKRSGHVSQARKNVP